MCAAVAERRQLRPQVTRRWTSPNYGERLLALDMIVLHYTGMRSAGEALDRLCDPKAGVSAHYLIEQDGTLHTLVDPAHRAWHAGVSSWEGEGDVNSRSVGIELVNPGHEWGYEAFPKPQIDTLIPLLGKLTRRYAISPAQVWGHSDIAPSRKEDPGEKFPWNTLARCGYGLWPKPGGLRLSLKDPRQLLFGIGYSSDDVSASEQAFKRHFRPQTLGQGWTRADTRCAQFLAGLKRKLV